jgi:hypothetical protein
LRCDFDALFVSERAHGSSARNAVSFKVCSDGGTVDAERVSELAKRLAIAVALDDAFDIA